MHCSETCWHPSPSRHHAILHRRPICAFSQVHSHLRQTVKTAGLPAGHNMNPDVFARPPAAGGDGGPGAWAFAGAADRKPETASAGRQLSAFGSARAVFNAKVNKGVAPGHHGPTTVEDMWTKHQGVITDIRAYAHSGEVAARARTLARAQIRGTRQHCAPRGTALRRARAPDYRATLLPRLTCRRWRGHGLLDQRRGRAARGVGRAGAHALGVAAPRGVCCWQGCREASVV